MTPPVAPLTVQTLLTQWTLQPTLTAVAAAPAVGYLAALARLRASAVPVHWPASRSTLFLTGVGLLVLAVDSGLGSYADVLFWVHMVQHLLLIMVVPALLAAGRPLSLILAALPAHRRSGWLRTVRSGPVAAVTHPAVGLACYAAVIVGTHLTGFQNARAGQHWLYVAELCAYLAAGSVLFSSLIGGQPLRWRPSFPGAAFALALTMPVDTFTGLLLMLSGQHPWPAVAAAVPAWGPSPMLDLQISGAIMWVGGDWIMLVILLILFATWSRGARRGATGQGAGRWLENARRRTLAAQVAGGLPEGAALDDDDRALQAYNEYLRRLHGHPPRSASADPDANRPPGPGA